MQLVLNIYDESTIVIKTVNVDNINMAVDNGQVNIESVDYNTTLITFNDASTIIAVVPYATYNIAVGAINPNLDANGEPI